MNLEKLVAKVEQWSKDRGLDQADSSKQFLKEIEGFPNHQVSSDGRVFLKSYTDMAGKNRSGKEIKQRIDDFGYPSVKINHLGKSRTIRVHRLVAESFIPNPNNEETVNHIDGNKKNNDVSNLEWASRSEQMEHAYELGLKKSTNVSRLLTKTSNSKPVKCYKKESDEVVYFLSARDCSKSLGYSERWCDKVISSMNGETKKFSLQYVSIDEVKENSSKTSISTLVELVELWSIDKSLHEADSAKQALKVFEEVGEVAAALARNDREALEDGIGDVIVTLIILGQQNDLSIERCLNTAYQEIADRKGKMVNGVFVKEEDLQEV